MLALQAVVTATEEEEEEPRRALAFARPAAARAADRGWRCGMVENRV